MPQSKVRRREVYEGRKTAGLCVQCGKYAPADATLSCLACLDAHRKIGCVSAKKRQESRKIGGLCTVCGVVLDNTSYVTCLACNAAQNTKGTGLRKTWRHKRQDGNLCRACGGVLEPGPFVTCTLCRELIKVGRRENGAWERTKDKAKRTQQHLKAEVFAAYNGARCVCCGEAHLEFLSIDHIDGGGEQHRPEGSSQRYTGTGLYRWLKRHNFPEGFRVLCMNCNFALGRFHYCPHTELVL